MEEKIITTPQNIELIDSSSYKEELKQHFDHSPDIARPLLEQATNYFTSIKQALYITPSFINAVKTAVPNITLQAILTDEQKKQLAKGALQLMTKKDGTLMANLINPETKKIVATIPLKSVQLPIEIIKAMDSLSIQMQLAHIAEQMQEIQQIVEEVRMGQENDRLASAYSCQQQLFQIMAIQKPELKQMALIHLAFNAENSRNLLMLSQKHNIEFIMQEPESIIKKMLYGATPEKINSRICEIRESLCAVNMVSLVETMAYQELGEHESARQSLIYFATFINDTYIAASGVIDRLDMVDSQAKNYWSKTLPSINKEILELPCITNSGLLEKEKMEDIK